VAIDGTYCNVANDGFPRQMFCAKRSLFADESHFTCLCGGELPVLKHIATILAANVDGCPHLQAYECLSLPCTLMSYMGYHACNAWKVDTFGCRPHEDLAFQACMSACHVFTCELQTSRQLVQLAQAIYWKRTSAVGLLSIQILGVCRHHVMMHLSHWRPLLPLPA